MKTFKLIALLVMFVATFFYCKPEEKSKDQDTLTLLIGAQMLIPSGETCNETTTFGTIPRASVTTTTGNTTNLRLFGTSSVTYGAIQLKSMKVNSLVTITRTSASNTTLSVDSTIYKGTCPVTVSQTKAQFGTDFTQISSSFTISQGVPDPIKIRFNVAGDYILTLSGMDNATGTVEVTP